MHASRNLRRGRLVRLLALVLALVLPAALGGCNRLMSTEEDFLPDKDHYTHGQELYVPEFQVLWERAKLAVDNGGYSLNDDLTQFTRREIVSRWNTSLQPQRYEGRRRRVVVHFREVKLENWVVSIAVQSQTNTDINDPLNILEADWRDDPPDRDLAEILLLKIELGFRTPGRVND